jgi:transcriptional regulator with XRE-family HTH domain
MMSFGKRLYDLRKASGLSQRDLAARVEIDYTYISKMERGRLEFLPSEATIRRLAEVLEADVLELLNLAGKIPPGFKGILEENALAAELLRLLGDQRLSDETYQRLLEIARQDQGLSSS